MFKQILQMMTFSRNFCDAKIHCIHTTHFKLNNAINNMEDILNNASGQEERPSWHVDTQCANGHVDVQYGDYHVDIQYQNLLAHIIATGSFKEPARQNMKRTKSIFGYMMRFNMVHGFPLLTTKPMFIKGMIAELLWFLRGDTNIKYLNDNGVTKFWHEDCYRWYLRNFSHNFPAGAQPMTFEQWCKALSDDAFASKHGDCGLIYGHQWRHFAGQVDQIAMCIKRILETPADRYKVVSAWNPADMSKQALPACHMLFQFNCRPATFEERLSHALHKELLNVDIAQLNDDDTVAKIMDNLHVPTQWLDLSLTQRSCDTCLGVPINIASYSLLLHLISVITNCLPGEFVWFGNDVHIYEHHIDAAKKQLLRTPFDMPQLVIHKEHWHMPSRTEWLSNTSKTFDAFIKQVNIEDFEIVDYQHYPAIAYELCTGLKK